MKNICLLGATGSIGQSVLDIIRANRDTYQLAAMSFNHQIDVAIKIIEEFKPSLVVTPDVDNYQTLKKRFSSLDFSQNLNDVSNYEVEQPIIINALVGSVGLLPTLEAINKKRDVLLANKETLVMAGELVMKAAQEKGVKIIPIDSEHSAIFQLLNNENRCDVKKIIITASGGSLFHKSLEELKNITVEEALNHPTWKMGAKITIDSATMVNKAFEIIEAYHLFQLPAANISTIIHPESVVHSMVEFNDNSIFAQMGVSDMRLPIQYALNYPRHIDNGLTKALDLSLIETLHFYKMDNKRFKAIDLARMVLEKGRFYPVVFNASNEKLVNMFLNGQITCDKIVERIEEEVNKTEELTKDLPYNLENILKIDKLIKSNIN